MIDPDRDSVPEVVRPASIYYIQGEQAADTGLPRTACRYIEGALAWREWMAGYDAATLDLTLYAAEPI